MAFDFDLKVLAYLTMITAGVYLVPIEASPPYYLASGIALMGIGGGLLYRKYKKEK